jgi:EAL domain-containing protein (putative c-di-GMP-specific phosphodiesterase class I)
LKNKEFEVVYQPIIVIATGELSGFETLLRWKHLKHGLVSPEKFIPIVEELEIIFDIGLWVLEQACLQLVNWKKLVGTKNVPTIAVNLSPLQLKQTDLLQKFDAIVCNIGTLKEKLKLEITESALMEHTGASNQRLKEFRQRGIELAIDDFGTGYSSLSYLDKLPVQALKIDRSFISSLFDKTSDNNGAHEIVRATIDLAHKLNMRVVAEGIETEEQLNVLKRYHCDFGQGYWISSPLTPEAATEFLLKNSVNNIE